ncbi:MAG: hypothetical protein AB1938_31020 [Myxococcota bacterium]
MNPAGDRVVVNTEGAAAAVVELVADGGAWAVAASLPGSAWAAAAGGDVLAVGWTGAGPVDVFERRDGGWAFSQSIPMPDGGCQSPGCGFGSSLALSDDGRVLLVSASQFNPSSAFLYERSDAGFVFSHRLTADYIQFVPDHLAVEFEAPVALSARGDVAAVGCPEEGSATVALRTDAGWVEELIVPAVGIRFTIGNGVSLSADGRRLAIACPLCSDDAGVFLYEDKSAR